MGRLKMISVDGSYLHNRFIANGVIWKLIATECQPREKDYKSSKEKIREQLLIDCKDTFKSENGQYHTVMRLTIERKCQRGEIQAINEFYEHNKNKTAVSQRSLERQAVQNKIL